MKTTLSILLLALSLAPAQPLLASAPLYLAHGGGHSLTAITQTQAESLAKKQLEGFVKNGKLHQSWAGIPLKGVTPQSYNGIKEWVFSFHNPKEPIKAQRTLYLFINVYGQKVGANFTGK